MVGNTGWGGVDAMRVADNMVGIIASRNRGWMALSRRTSRSQAQAFHWMNDAGLF
jgi:hypothetical protein